MIQQSKDLRVLLKQELLSTINKRITPNAIKKNFTNELDITIRNQIKNFRNSKSNVRNLNEDQSELRRVNEDQSELRRVNVEQGELRRVNEEQGELRRVNEEQGELRRVNEEQGELRRVNEEQGELRRVNEELGELRRVNEEQRGNVINEVNQERQSETLLNEQRDPLIKKRLIINKSVNSQNYKIKMISEFKRIINNRNSDDYKFNNIWEKEDIHVRIKKAFDGTKRKDLTKWFNIIEFLKLTENMDYGKLEEILSLKSDNIRKQVDGFKKIELYLSHFKRCNKSYYKLNLQRIYFQKIHIEDWNDVLMELNRIVRDFELINSSD